MQRTLENQALLCHALGVSRQRGQRNGLSLSSPLMCLGDRSGLRDMSSKIFDI